MQQLPVAQLFEYNRERLKLSWLCGSREALIRFQESDVVPADLVVYLNLIHPERLQVLGQAEVA